MATRKFWGKWKGKRHIKVALNLRNIRDEEVYSLAPKLFVKTDSVKSYLPKKKNY